MSDIRKLINIISETTAGATASGSVASVAQPMETLRRRNDEDYAAESADSTPEMPQVLEYGNWENSALTTSKKLKKARSKAKKIVKSIYGEDKPEVDETLHGKQKKLDMNKSGSLDSEDFALLRSKKKVSESRKLASNLAEGRLKQALWDDAEELSLDDFLEKHSKHDSDTEWLTVFWKKTNGVEDDKQDVAEGIVDTINRGVKSVKRVLDRNQLELPTKPETVKIGNFEVELTPMLDQGYIETLWQDSEGRKRRVEISTTYYEWDDERGELENKKTRKELYSDIKEEILFVEKQLEKNKKQGVAEGKKKIHYKVDVLDQWGDIRNVFFIAQNDEDAKEIARQKKGRNLQRQVGYDNFIKIPMNAKEEPLSPWYSGVGGVPGSYRIKEEQGVAEGSGQEGLQQDKKLLQDIIDFAKQNGYKVTYRSPQKSWEEVRPGPGVSILYFENNNTELAFYAEVVKKSTRIYIRFGSIDGSFLDDIVFTPKEFLTAFKHAHQKLLDPANRDDSDHPLRSFLDLRLGTIDGRPVRDVIAPKPARIKASNKQGVAEGYILKKTKVHKYTVSGDPDNYIPDKKAKDVDYEIINNKTGKVVGTAHWPGNDYYAGTKMEITMRNGARRLVDVVPGDNPQSAFNRFVKNPKTSKKYKDEQGVAEGSSFDRWANARAASQLHKLKRDHNKDKKASSDEVQQYGDDWEQRQDDWEQRQIEKMKKYRNSEQDVTEGDDGDDTPATERVFKYNKTNPERLIARMEKEIKQAEAEGWTIVAKRESPKTGNIVVKMIRKQGVAEDITRRGFLRGLGAAGIATAGIGSATSAQARSTEEFRQTYKAARELLQQNPKLTSAEIAKQLQITEPEPRQKLPVTMLGRWGAIYLAMQDMNLPIR